MKKILFSAAFMAVSAAGFAQTSMEPPLPGATTGSGTIETLNINDPIPMASVQLKTTSGKTTSLEQNMNKNGLLVMFSCNTCPYVVKSQPRTIEVMKMAEKMNVGMVVLNSNAAQRKDADSYEAMVSYASKQKYTVPYAVDEQNQLADAFGAMHTPEVYLFDAKGKLVYKGAMEDNPSDPVNSKKMFLADAMKNMTAGKEINPAETKSIGCSIKR